MKIAIMDFVRLMENKFRQQYEVSVLTHNEVNGQPCYEFCFTIRHINKIGFICEYRNDLHRFVSFTPVFDSISTIRLSYFTEIEEFMSHE